MCVEMGQKFMPINPIILNESAARLKFVLRVVSFARFMQAIDRPNKVSRSKLSGRKAQAENIISPADVTAELETQVLVDGFKMVFDPEKAAGHALSMRPADES